MRPVWWTATALLLAHGTAGAQGTRETPLQELLHQKVATVDFGAVASAARSGGARGRGVTLLTAEQIRRAGARSPAEALRLVSWLKLPAGGERRGAYPRLLVLFDTHATGVEIASAEWPELALTVQQIEAIEAVPGPGTRGGAGSRYDAIVRIRTR